MKKPYVTLSGPVRNKPSWQAEGWMEEAESLLHPEFVTLNPLRGFRPPTFGVYTPEAVSQTRTDNEVVERCLADLRKSRVLLRYLPAGAEPSFGCDFLHMEAKRLGIPVVLAGPGAVSMEKLGPWMRWATVRNFFKLESAVAYIKATWLFPDEQPEPTFDPPVVAVELTEGHIRVGGRQLKGTWTSECDERTFGRSDSHLTLYREAPVVGAQASVETPADVLPKAS